MKKQLLRYMSGLIPAVALFVNVNAQVAKSELEMNLKEFIFSEAKTNEVIANNGNVASTRASKDFIKRFGYMGKASWFEIKDGFAVRFVSEGVDIKAYYNRDGRYFGTIRTYSQEKMPKDVRALVRSTYYDYTIYQVNEVSLEDKTVYLVKIEDDSNFKTIRVLNSEMDVYENFVKG